jgi:hypothetical protein
MIRRSLRRAIELMSGMLLASLCLAVQGGPFDAERARIAGARAQADAALAEAEAQCMQRFVVTSCLIEARQSHRSTVEPLRQESMLLDERERKQRAADRIDQVRAKAEAAQARAAVPILPVPPVAAASASDMPGVRPKLRGESSLATSTVNAASAASGPSFPERVGSRASAVSPILKPPKRSDASARRLTPAPDSAATAAAANRSAEAFAHREQVERRNAERDAKHAPAKGLPIPGAASSASGAAGR